VDTNVWYWLTYPPASSSAKSYQTTSYPNYVAAAFNCGSRLCYSGLSLAELSSLIERSEYKLSSYSAPPPNSSQRTPPIANPKEYRHNYASARANVVAEVQAAWGLVASDGDLVELRVDAIAAAEALNCFQASKADGYDLLLIEAMRQNSVTKVITDDGDYSTIFGIQVFTANRNVINAANNQGKLRVK
ncbi:MAG: hypothetical protein AAFQ89_05640, partial [Cyanobacteria bacterium J06626_18]